MEMFPLNFPCHPSSLVSNEIKSFTNMKISIDNESGNEEKLHAKGQGCIVSEIQMNSVEVDQTQSDNHIGILPFYFHVYESSID